MQSIPCMLIFLDVELWRPKLPPDNDRLAAVICRVKAKDPATQILHSQCINCTIKTKLFKVPLHTVQKRTMVGGWL